MKVSEIDEILQFKLADAVSDNGEGHIFGAQDRLNYIYQAYQRLVRDLAFIMRRYQPDWTSGKAIYVIQHKTDEEESPNANN